MDKLTKILCGAKARKKILEGVNLIYDTTKITLGPEGKNALLPRTFNRGPRITNDGITIAELAKLTKDEHVSQAAESFIESAKRTNELAGDGTTTTAIIGGYLINKIFNSMSDSDTPILQAPNQKTKIQKGVRALRKDMLVAKDLVIEEIKAKAKPIKTLADLEKIALVAIGKEDKEAAKTVAKITWDVARDANGDFIDNYIDVVEGYKSEIETEVIKGMRFPAKVAHRAYVNNPERFEMVAEDVPVLITNYKLESVKQIAGILERTNVSRLALVAPNFSPAVLKWLGEAISKGGYMLYPIKVPALRTEQMEDLAVYTGATLIDKDTEKKLENVIMGDLGFAEKIVVKDVENKEDAILLGGRGEKVKRGQGNLITERQKILKGQLVEQRNEMTRMSLERRIANLSSAVGVVRVGASTNNEALYLKLKIEDGVFACKAALKEGYVKGGGICLRDIAKKLPENILTDALIAPYNQIQTNAGGKLDIGKDIIDPAKVVRLEVEHGVSVASAMITTDISVPYLRDKSPADGYEDIAWAIRGFTNLQAIQLSLVKENQDFEDSKMDDVFAEAMMTDRD